MNYMFSPDDHLTVIYFISSITLYTVNLNYVQFMYNHIDSNMKKKNQQTNKTSKIKTTTTKKQRKLTKTQPPTKKHHKNPPKNIHTQSKTILVIPFRPSYVLSTRPLSYLALQPFSYYEGTW
jgi:hypothetical protein